MRSSKQRAIQGNLLKDQTPFLTLVVGGLVFAMAGLTGCRQPVATYPGSVAPAYTGAAFGNPTLSGGGVAAPATTVQFPGVGGATRVTPPNLSPASVPTSFVPVTPTTPAGYLNPVTQPGGLTQAAPAYGSVPMGRALAFQNSPYAPNPNVLAGGSNPGFGVMKSPGAIQGSASIGLAPIDSSAEAGALTSGGFQSRSGFSSSPPVGSGVVQSSASLPVGDSRDPTRWRRPTH